MSEHTVKVCLFCGFQTSSSSPSLELHCHEQHGFNLAPIDIKKYEKYLKKAQSGQHNGRTQRSH